MEHSESLRPGGYRFFYDDALFRPGTDSFLLSSLPRLKPGLRVCDLGSGTGLLGLLLLQREPLAYCRVNPKGNRSEYRYYSPHAFKEKLK